MLVKREVLQKLVPVDPDAKPETASLMSPDDVNVDDTLWADLESAAPAPASPSVGGQYLLDDADKARQRLRR